MGRYKHYIPFGHTNTQGATSELSNSTWTNKICPKPIQICSVFFVYFEILLWFLSFFFFFP